MDLPAARYEHPDLRFTVAGDDEDQIECSLRTLHSKEGVSCMEALKGLSKPSQFGRDRDSVLDPSVRHSLEIDGSKIEFHEQTQRWLDVAAMRLADVLGLRRKHDLVKLYPHKLLIYPEGGKFDEHRDTAHRPRAVASVVARIKPDQLQAQGGMLALRPVGTDWGDAPRLDDTGLYAFPLETPHRVEPVMSGTVVSLTFDLVRECLPGNAEEAEERKAVLAKLNSSIPHESGTHDKDGEHVLACDLEVQENMHWSNATRVDLSLPAILKVDPSRPEHQDAWYDFDRRVPRVKAFVPGAHAPGAPLKLVDRLLREEIANGLRASPVLVLLSDARYVRHHDVEAASDAGGQLWCGGMFQLRGRDRVLLEALRQVHTGECDSPRCRLFISSPPAPTPKVAKKRCGNCQSICTR